MMALTSALLTLYLHLLLGPAVIVTIRVIGIRKGVGFLVFRSSIEVHAARQERWRNFLEKLRECAAPVRPVSSKN